MAARLLLASLIALPLMACSEGEELGECSPDTAEYVAPNPGGKVHGAACTTDAECAYERCYKSPTLTGDVGICTKDCGGCNACTLDGEGYTCVRFSPYDEDLPTFCVPVCSSDGDCAAPLVCRTGDGTAQRVCRKAP
jgi:hypothetical protein